MILLILKGETTCFKWLCPNVPYVVKKSLFKMSLKKYISIVFMAPILFYKSSTHLLNKGVGNQLDNTQIKLYRGGLILQEPKKLAKKTCRFLIGVDIYHKRAKGPKGDTWDNYWENTTFMETMRYNRTLPRKNSIKILESL